MPKLPSRTMDTFRSVSCDNPRTVENEPNRIAKPEKAMMKPVTRKSGRHRSCWPMEAPSRTGSNGRMQGAPAVSKPAANARAISIMSDSLRRSGSQPSLQQREKRLAFHDDVGGELTAGDAAGVLGRMRRVGGNEEDVAGFQRDWRFVPDLIFERALQDINNLFAGMGVLAERHGGREVDAYLNGLASGRAEIVPLQIRPHDPALLRLRAKRRQNGSGDKRRHRHDLHPVQLAHVELP